MTCVVNKLSGGNGKDSMHGNSVVCLIISPIHLVFTLIRTNGSNTSTVPSQSPNMSFARAGLKTLVSL